MPGYNCSIKDRMLYSSCKKAVTEVVESLGIEIHKKVFIYLKSLSTTFIPIQNLFSQTNVLLNNIKAKVIHIAQVSFDCSF
jgi:hypothetical protein